MNTPAVGQRAAPVKTARLGSYKGDTNRHTVAEVKRRSLGKDGISKGNQKETA